jgi:hypothetical protein
MLGGTQQGDAALPLNLRLIAPPRSGLMLLSGYKWAAVKGVGKRRLGLLASLLSGERVGQSA